MIETEFPAEDVACVQAIDCPFGKITFDEKDLLHFPDGLYGYEQHHQYIVWGNEQYKPFQWLICLDEPQLMFPVIDPKLVYMDYAPRQLGGEVKNPMLVIVTMGKTVESVTANLRAPIVIQKRKRQARQIILTDSIYPLRFRVLKP